MKKMLRILNQILLDSSNLPTTKCQNGFLVVMHLRFRNGIYLNVFGQRCFHFDGSFYFAQIGWFLLTKKTKLLYYSAVV